MIATRFLLLSAVLIGCSGTTETVGSTSTGGNGGAGGTSAASGSGHGAVGTGDVAASASASSGSGPTSSSNASTGASSGSGGSCGPCGWSCCGPTCVNKNNDIDNCGDCGVVCGGPHPFCDNGVCGTAPCSGGTCSSTTFCCGGACCNPGELCCDVPASVSFGPMCTTPVNGTCPVGCNGCVCTSPETPIATPDGTRPIRDLREGDLVYSVHRGRVVAVPVRRTATVPAPNHVVVRVTLATGAVLEISPKHPTADGGSFGDLRTGSTIDGVAVVDAHLVPFRFERTYDVLPDSDTGTYFAGGVLIGSTLAPNGATVVVPTAPASSL